MVYPHGRAIVLLEGVDKTGKSTEAAGLVKALGRYGPVKLIHNGPPAPGEDLFRTYLSQLHDADIFPGSTVIDRMHWSEAAYSRVFRLEEQRLPRLSVVALDVVLQHIGGLAVWKTRPWADIADAMDSDDYKHTADKQKQLDTVAQLCREFSQCYDNRHVAAVKAPFGKPATYLNEAADLRSKALETKGVRR